ncbi:MAG TPA: glycerol-3-phosphate dehydrogenase C-terminal domain-containing protein, partial [Euzebyales bacterium]|nr:glycerol-3-phosphate dehydrogenase C-terminal domain-containing protein [Euzebyales bacterium]
EVVYAVQSEGALHLEDVLVRRTRISFETPDRGVAAAEAVVGLIGDELGWDDAARDHELTTYRARVDAEVAAHREATEASASEVRQRAPEIRTGAA